MEQTELMEQPQQSPLERLRQVPQDPTQQSQTVAAAPLQHLISAFLGELLAPLEQLALRVQLALTAQTARMVLMEPLQLFQLERSLQVPLAQAQLLRIAVAALLQHLTSASLVVLLVPLGLQELLVPPALLAQMEAMELQRLFLLAL